ncbi:hypothetical protein GOBAR_DD02869 [Gossypium barbadense]|nr:hypothetical protein GOBAR_DD02869 [Gossypium barbadense]
MKVLVISLSFTFFSSNLCANSNAQEQHFDTGTLNGDSFLEGFLFGTAASAYQVEGMASEDSRGPSIWDAYVKVLDGTGEINWEGVDYYNRLIDYLLENGITPHANFQDFADYAEFCFKIFGGRVKTWMTFNEPRVVAALGFDNGINPPNRCSKQFGNCTDGNSATEPYIAAHHLILSHVEAVKRYREKYQDKQNGRIGIFLDFVWYKPLTRSKADNYAAQRARDFHIGWFLRPLVYGKHSRTMQKIFLLFTTYFYFLLFTFDVLCLNHYTFYYIYDPHRPPSINAIMSITLSTFLNLTSVNTNAQEMRAHSEWLYEVPWDINRVNFYRSYLKELKRAMDDGANVSGYSAWSVLDNFEWLLGYTSRFGLVYVDHNDLKRYSKLLAYWFKQMLERKDS